MRMLFECDKATVYLKFGGFLLFVNVHREPWIYVKSKPDI